MPPNPTLTSDLVHGHVLLADWLLLLAAILFALEVAAIVLADRTPPAGRAIGRGILAGAGLCLVAVALLVL
jgi:hypothetical protein